MSDKENTSLVPRVSSELTRLPLGVGAIIDGMVTDATDIMRTHDAIRHRIGDYEFREPDYRQILIWAEAVGMTPEDLVMRMQGYERLQGYGGYNIYEGYKFAVSDGAITEFQWGFRGVGLDLSQVPRLKKLNCGFRKLTELNLSRVPHLEELCCPATHLAALDLSRVPKLKTLSCTDNRLTELDLSRVPHLEELYCGENHLKELDLSRVPRLERLACWGNDLIKLDLLRVPCLKELRCQGNHLKELDLSRVPKLEILWCEGNRLTTLDLSRVPRLKVLHCGDNALTELDISALKTPTLDVNCDYDIRIHKRDDQNPKIFRRPFFGHLGS